MIYQVFIFQCKEDLTCLALRHAKTCFWVHVDNEGLGHICTVWSGPSLSTNRIIGTESINGEQRPGWYFAHGQDDLNLDILHMFEGTFSLNSLLASGDFCRLLIIFANSLDPDQARQNVGPDLDPDCLTLWCYSWKIFFEKVKLKKKIHSRQKKTCKITQHAKS